MEKCRVCNKNKIFNKKRSMCQPCYQKFYREGKFFNQRNDGEIEFIKNYFTHNEWIFHPCMFYLDGIKYTPDFYDGKRNVFIEVSATRQAYHFNKDKYDRMKQIFPKIALEIRDPLGTLIEDADNRKKWIYQLQDKHAI